MQSTKIQSEFELLANPFLKTQSGLSYEWRIVASKLWGDRTDLICVLNSNIEVWASFRESSVAIGTGENHTDFEDFGRGLTDQALASEAFKYFEKIVTQNKHSSVESSDA
jgi:hypothetical protein